MSARAHNPPRNTYVCIHRSGKTPPIMAEHRVGRWNSVEDAMLLHAVEAQLDKGPEVSPIPLFMSATILLPRSHASTNTRALSSKVVIPAQSPRFEASILSSHRASIAEAPYFDSEQPRCLPSPRFVDRVFCRGFYPGPRSRKLSPAGAHTSVKYAMRIMLTPTS